MNLELNNRAFRCVLHGHSIWNLRLDEFGVVDVGRTSEIEGWWVRRGQLVLGTIEGAERYVLSRSPDGSWRGAGPNRTQLQLIPEEYLVSK